MRYGVDTKMREWPDEDFAHIRQGIVRLAQQEVKQKNLNQLQLTALFHLLAYGANVVYKENEEPYNYLGYGGAGWLIEDHF